MMEHVEVQGHMHINEAGHVAAHEESHDACQSFRPQLVF